jgi:hypothetical protein
MMRGHISASAGSMSPRAPTRVIPYPQPLVAQGFISAALMRLPVHAQQKDFVGITFASAKSR